MNTIKKTCEVIFNIHVQKVIQGYVHWTKMNSNLAMRLRPQEDSFLTMRNFGLKPAINLLILGPITSLRMSLKNIWPHWVVYLNLQYSHVTLVSWYFFWQRPIDHNMNDPLSSYTQILMPIGHLANNAQSFEENLAYLVDIRAHILL